MIKRYYKDNYTDLNLKYCDAAIKSGWIVKFEVQLKAPDKDVMGRWTNKITVTPEDDWQTDPTVFVEWMNGFMEVK